MPTFTLHNPKRMSHSCSAAIDICIGRSLLFRPVCLERSNEESTYTYLQYVYNSEHAVIVYTVISECAQPCRRFQTSPFRSVYTETHIYICNGCSYASKGCV